MITPVSELSWRLADYQAANIEAPDRVISNPSRTEGEMMTDEEIEEYIKDSIATLRILADRNSERLAQIRANYHADLAYLVSLGRMDEADYNDLIQPDNLHF